MEEEDMTSKKLGWMLLIWLLCFVCPCHSQETALPQTSADSTTTVSAEDATANVIDSMAASDNFVTASLVITAPLKELFSVFGHATLRLECPTHQLDFIYTWENENDKGVFTTIVAGNAKAFYTVVPTDSFLTDNREIGREVTQYRLNLTPKEKQELWRYLDDELMAGDHHKFNLFTANCQTALIDDMQRCLIGEHFEWGPMHYPMTLCDGDMFRVLMQKAPWAEFLLVTFGGTAYDRFSPTTQRVTPKTIIPMLREARFVNDSTGESRFVITEPGTVLVADADPNKEVPITPMMTFGVLLALALVVTAAEWLAGWRQLSRWFDILLFTSQALVWTLVLYITLFSNTFLNTWNWYLIGFLPLPLFIWTCLRGRFASFCWLAYCILLLLFIAATPFIGALDLPHQLITAILLVRCGSHFFMSKRKSVTCG